jgi:type IV pilus assembly protein PilV
MLSLSRGFTLIEVLVTLVILLFGLLGIAGLMAKGQRASFEAFQRQQALALANDMAERVRANSTSVITYAAGAPLSNPLGTGVAYNQLLTGAITNCGTGNCSATNLATYDLALWDGLLNGYTESQVVSGNRVGGIINAQGCIENIATTAAACPAPGSGIATYTQSVRVSVAWQGHDDTVPPTYDACGTGAYGAETKRRLVSLDLMVLQPCP